MNRKNRRHAVKTGTVAKAMKQVETDAMYKAVDLYTIAFVWQLYNKRHWLPSTIHTLLDQVQETFVDINNGDISLVDITQALKDEVGFELKRK